MAYSNPNIFKRCGQWIKDHPFYTCLIALGIVATIALTFGVPLFPALLATVKFAGAYLAPTMLWIAMTAAGYKVGRDHYLSKNTTPDPLRPGHYTTELSAKNHAVSFLGAALVSAGLTLMITSILPNIFLGCAAIAGIGMLAITGAKKLMQLISNKFRQSTHSASIADTSYSNAAKPTYTFTKAAKVTTTNNKVPSLATHYDPLYSPPLPDTSGNIAATRATATMDVPPHFRTPSL